MPIESIVPKGHSCKNHVKLSKDQVSTSSPSSLDVSIERDTPSSVTFEEASPQVNPMSIGPSS